MHKEETQVWPALILLGMKEREKEILASFKDSVLTSCNNEEKLQ